MLKIFFRKFNKIFFINNQNKLIVEFVGNPGSGKSTIINHIYNTKYFEGNSFENKKKFFNFAKIFIFCAHKNIGIFFIIIKFLTVLKYFLSEDNKKNYIARLLRFKKLLFILLRMLCKIYYSSENIIFVESILHQLINYDCPNEKFFNKILALYGHPKLKLIFLDCPIDESLNRMISRGDNFEKSPSKIKRYLDSDLTQKCLLKFLSKEYRFISGIEEPLKLY